jgi:hypothetical protein
MEGRVMGYWSDDFRLTPGNPPNDGILFVNHEPQSRSGHMGHALVEYAPGRLLAFYPSCSSEDARFKGHSGYGWMEYKRSEDGGATWSAPIIEPNSKALFDEQIGRTMMCEKAVSPEEGTVVLFYLTCDMQTNGHVWEPYFEPKVATSHDGGQHFSQARLFLHEPGRIYDACVHNGAIYVLFFANPELPGIAHLTEHEYRLYVSEDGGESFALRSRLPFQSTKHSYYGSFAFAPDGRLIAYAYDELDERNLKGLVSEDEGRSWGPQRRMFFEQKIRNPQFTFFADRFFVHGRSGNYGEHAGHFILYASLDGLNWDAGTILRHATEGAGAYSNNLIVHMPDGRERLLIQASHAYRENRTNILHWFLDMEG